MLTKANRIFFFWAVLLLFSCHHNKSEKVFIPSGKKINHTHNYYKKAEQINYSVQYGLLHIGNIIITTSEGTQQVDNIPCYHVKVNSKLSGATGFVFSINDSWESFIDTSSLLPHKFSKSLQENKYRRTDYTIFDRIQEKAFVTNITNPAAPESNNYPITTNIEDMISSFFLLRNVPFESMKVNDTATIDAFVEERCFNIRIKLLGMEKIKALSKKQKAYLITTSVAGVESDEQVKCWVSADDKRMPLKVRVKIPLGAVELELKEYKSN